MGMGKATGKDKAQEAANMAISSPLLETSIKGAKGVIISISASVDVGLEDVDLAANMVRNECNPDASIIFGVGFDETLEDEMRITIIAANFDENAPEVVEEKVEEKPVEEKVPAKQDKSVDLFDGLF